MGDDIGYVCLDRWILGIMLDFGMRCWKRIELQIGW